MSKVTMAAQDDKFAQLVQNRDDLHILCEDGEVVVLENKMKESALAAPQAFVDGFLLSRIYW